MTMNYGFEVELNGEILARAGYDNHYFVVSCVLHSLRRKLDESEELYISVGGLSNEEHVYWINQNLKFGDKISLRVINDNFDMPVTIGSKISKEEETKRKIEYYYKLKEELKEYLEE